MGYYIEVERPTQKVEQLIKRGALTLLQAPDKLNRTMVTVCVVENGVFDAAGIAYSEAELREFTNSRDLRPKTWLLMDYATVVELCPRSAEVLQRWAPAKEA